MEYEDDEYGGGYGAVEGGEDWSQYGEDEYECPNCGGIVTSEDQFCPHCDAEFESEVFHCPVCGAEVTSEDTKCPECGSEFPGVGDEEETEAEALADDGYEVMEMGPDEYEVEEEPGEVPIERDEESYEEEEIGEEEMEEE